MCEKNLQNNKKVSRNTKSRNNNHDEEITGLFNNTDEKNDISSMDMNMNILNF
jgi:hypothetical protein